MKLFIAALSAAFSLFAASSALATPITSVSGTSEIWFEPRSTGDESRGIFPVGFPEIGTVEFLGNDEGPHGVGRVSYTLAGTDAGGSFDVDLSTRHDSAATGAGWSRFSISFTTDRPLRYRFTAGGIGSEFGVALDDYSATGFIDVFGDISGDWPGPVDPNDGVQYGFDAISRQGVLAPGVHLLSGDAGAGTSRDGGGDANLSFRLVLTPVPEPAALPGVAWLALPLMFRRRRS